MAAIFKCKVCGGNLEFTENKGVGKCPYCGATQTLPNTNDEKIANLFNRANNLRLKCEFDRAEQVYESIVQEDDSQAEAHWGIILCKYGVEYVESTKTHERIPTCHRSSYEAIKTDADYIAAIDYSNSYQQAIYEAEAREIDRIQKGILEVAREEKPFDVFICYKESDDNGNKTIDSTYANDIYYQLTDKGFKVFYAAITLEDKLGRDYEPYIFAALNSAKVMLVIGTKPEYFNAVWVKNEWSRYLKLMKVNKEKTLIPCYRDMSAYELPDDFVHLQAQDMSKIGFITDLIRGVEKVVSFSKNETAKTTSSTASGEVAPLLKRAHIFLEDGDWKSADEYCERVLDLDPENAEAYLAKLMAETHSSREELLSNCESPIDSNSNYQKVLKYGDAAIKSRVEGYAENIRQAFAKIEHQVDAIAKAIQNRDSQKGGMSLQEQLSKEQGDYSSLQILSQSFDGKLAELQGLRSQKQSLNERMNQLKTRRQSLGIFARKEKAQIDSEIDQAEATISSLEKRMASKSSELKGFTSKQAVDAKLQETADKVTVLKTKVEENMKSDNIELSYIDAVKLYRRDKAVNARFNVKYDDMKYQIGSIHFGQYPTAADGKIEPIKWEILDIQEDKLLLVSSYILDFKEYNIITNTTAVTWETCTLRSWLNTEFLSTAFSTSEQMKIQTTGVPADKIFLLSYDEAKKYHKVYPVFANGSPGLVEHSWLLRTPGYYIGSIRINNDYVQCVGDVGRQRYGIRPALWVSQSAIYNQ